MQDQTHLRTPRNCTLERNALVHAGPRHADATRHDTANTVVTIYHIIMRKMG